MKKLLQINVVVNTGSTGRIAEEIGQSAMQQGWESHIAYGRKPRASMSKAIRIGSGLDVIFHKLQTLLFDRHGLGSVKSTQKMIEKIKELEPNIIHLHNIHGYYINYEILFNFLKTANIPVVWTLHDCWPFTGHCSHFEFAGCEKWKTQCKACPQVQEYPASLLLDRSKQNFNLKKELFTSLNNVTLVPVSQWLNNLLKYSFLSNHSSRVINNGVNLDLFVPTHQNELRADYNLENHFIILGVANIWHQRRGLNDFIKLSKILPVSYKIILVGVSEKLQKSLPESILAISRTDSAEELAALYSLADLYVNPTYEDNFPTTNIEALACGTPVLTYETGGSVEAVTAETGFILKQGDIDGILAAIKTVKQNGKKHYTSACRLRAEKFYNKDERYQDYVNLYDDLLLNKKIQFY